MSKDSFIFVQGSFAENEVGTGDGTYLKYYGPLSELEMGAVVICKQSNDQLFDALERFSDSADTKDYDLSLAYNGCPVDGIVCCVIIPLK